MLRTAIAAGICCSLVTAATANLVELNLTGANVSGKLIIDTSKVDQAANNEIGLYDGAFTIDNLTINGDSYTPGFFFNSTLTLSNDTFGGTTDIIEFSASGGFFGGLPVDTFDLTFEDLSGNLLSNDDITFFNNISQLDFGTGDLAILDEAGNITGEASVTVDTGNPIPTPGSILLGFLGLSVMSARRRKPILLCP